MSRLLQQAKTTQKRRADTITTSSTGPTTLKRSKNSSQLRQLLLEVPGVSLPQGVSGVITVTTTSGAKGAGSGLNSYGAKVMTTPSTDTTTYGGKSIYTPSGRYSDVNEDRGKKINVHTLADYCEENGIYSPEEFMQHATQMGNNRGRELYRALSLKDWEKKLTQAIDIAQSYTPDTPFRARVENYKVPSGFDLWKGTATYHEYMELFKHHGIGLDKLRRFFKTLCGDGGKINTIYMWGKADADKTTIIKLFDAFYHKWEKAFDVLDFNIGTKSESLGLICQNCW